jgi:hypothetical protein
MYICVYCEQITVHMHAFVVVMEHIEDKAQLVTSLEPFGSSIT